MGHSRRTAGSSTAPSLPLRLARNDKEFGGGRERSLGEGGSGGVLIFNLYSIFISISARDDRGNGGVSGSHFSQRRREMGHPDREGLSARAFWPVL